VIVVQHQVRIFSAISWRRTSYIPWDDDYTLFVLGLHTELDFCNSLKHQFAGRHVAPLGHIILIPRQQAFALSPKCCVSRNKC